MSILVALLLILLIVVVLAVVVIGVGLGAIIITLGDIIIWAVIIYVITKFLKKRLN